MKRTLRMLAVAIAAALLVGTTTLGIATRPTPVMQVADGDMGGGF
jgi:Spy/CpxP family protein refolding chaperone